MDAASIGDLLQLALGTAFDLAAPMLFAGLIVGFGISIVQAATQIQEVTLVFIPKMMAVGVTMWLWGPSMYENLLRLVREVTVHISQVSQLGGF